MSPEDMQRFEVDINFWDDEADLICRECGKKIQLTDGDRLAELVQRADEHTEVCR